MKTYTTREAIIKDIDSAYRKMGNAQAIAQEHLDQEELLKGSSEVIQLRHEREAADKQFRKIKRLQTDRLPKLKECLAMFDTLPLPGTSTEMTGESAPPAQPGKGAGPDDELKSTPPEQPSVTH